jgi:hypothetical protein
LRRKAIGMKRMLSIIILAILVLPTRVSAGDYSYENFNFRMVFPDSYYVIDESNVYENTAFIESFGVLRLIAKE